MQEKSNYFNKPEYVDYLIKNFDIEGFNTASQDTSCKRPDINLILSYTALLNITPGNKLLEIGCGLGRLIDVLTKRYKAETFGIDVSKDAINLAMERLPLQKSNLLTATAETIPFPDQSFDCILCWGVFDLTDQGRALSEMMRVLKVGGQLLLTGKNNLFADDDEDALIAEIKSREKGIPNHYTDYDALNKAISANGGEMSLEHFFCRRGDFMNGKLVVERPNSFIEYCVIIKKNTHAKPTIIEVAKLYSKTWSLKNG